MDRDDDLAEVGRELRELEGEFRLAAEEDEYWAMKQARRARSLAEVAYDSMSRGDRLEVWAGTRVFTGTVQYARNDLLVLRTGSGITLDLNLTGPILLRIIEPAATPGIGVARQGPSSFKARLSELEQASSSCELIVPTAATEVIGRIVIRGPDHVVIEDINREEWIAPIAWIAAVIER